MRIAVLIKHAVNVRSVRIDPETGVPGFDPKSGLDRPDLHAISDAVELRESSGGHVTVVGVGPAAMKDDFITALATGADEAMHVVSDHDAGSLFVARALADALRDGNFDVIMAGKLSEDYGTGQVGMQVAELLGMPHLSGVLRADGSGSVLTVSYELDGFPDEIEVPTPVVLVLSAREGEPSRHSSLRGMMAARKKVITEITPAAQDDGALAWTAPMAARRGGDRIVIRNEEPAEAARKLAEWLREHRLVG